MPLFMTLMKFSLITPNLSIISDLITKFIRFAGCFLPKPNLTSAYS